MNSEKENTPLDSAYRSLSSFAVWSREIPIYYVVQFDSTVVYTWKIHVICGAMSGTTLLIYL